MTDDLDLSPEAMERLAARCEQYARSITGEVNPRHSQMITAATLIALASENDRLRAEAMRDEGSLTALLKRAEEIDPILEVEFDTQLDVERNPCGATDAIEKALYLIRDLAAFLSPETQPTHIAAALDDSYAALNQHLHGDAG